MELLYALPALILALTGLIGLRKELDQEEKQHLDTISDYPDTIQELKLVKKSNASNQGWNAKYRKTIEELEEKNQDQADTIKRMNSQFDEVHVLLETLLVTPKKKQAELVNKFIFENE